MPGGNSILRRCGLWGGLLLLPAHAAWGGMKEILQAIQQSEFRFARTVSEVPFMPLGWVQDSYYPRAEFDEESGTRPDGTAVENTVSLGAVIPPVVGRRNMLLAGGDVAWDYLSVRSGPYPDQSVLRLTPVLGWLHQWGEEDLIGAFAAPIFSKELRDNGPWSCNGYGGVIGLHYFSDQFQLLYGGVYQYSFGQHSGYPYLGCQWLPTPRWSISLVFPWPAITYALSDRWILQLGVAPGGSSWVQHDGAIETTESLSSWNVTAGVGYRFYEKFWFYAAAGVAGLRGLEIESDAERTRWESGPSAVATVAIQFRP